MTELEPKSCDYDQGWIDIETNREYRMGGTWSFWKFQAQKIDLHLYKCGINPIGTGLLIGIYIGGLILGYW